VYWLMHLCEGRTVHLKLFDYYNRPSDAATEALRGCAKKPLDRKMFRVRIMQ